MKFLMSFLACYIIFKTKISQLQFFNFLSAEARKIHCATRSRLPFKIFALYAPALRPRALRFGARNADRKNWSASAQL